MRVGIGYRRRCSRIPELDEQASAIVSRVVEGTVPSPMRQHLPEAIVAECFIGAIGIADSGNEVRDAVARVSGRAEEFVRDGADVIRVSAVGIRVIDVVTIWMSDPGWVANHQFIGIAGGIAIVVFDALEIIIRVVGKDFVNSVEI